MDIKTKVEFLVVDTNAFIKNAPLQDIGTNIITEQDVVNEITSKRQLRRLVVLPYDLIIRDVFPENVKFVTEFAQKTGDYISLSATDIKVIALTYQLEKEKVGTKHLKTEPKVVRTINVNAKKPSDYPKDLAGFYVPQKGKNLNTSKNSTNDKDNFKENSKEQQSKEEDVQLCLTSCSDDKSRDSISSSDSASSNSDVESDYETAVSDLEQDETNELAKKFTTLTCKPEEFEVEGNGDHNVDDILASVNTEDQIQDDTESEEDDEDCDGGGWITPSNITQVKRQINSDVIEEKPATVACLTTDFAMQNVLMQIGLKVATMDGKVIRQLRTFIFRCYACFKTTSIMTKVFCPKCGNKTLKKVSISVDRNGKQRMHINARRPLSTKGKRFSLPTPQGGKHANNPILCEDQPLPDQRLSKLARTKNDPLNDDYIAGYSPFVMRDVNSKSAMLGIRPMGDLKHWMRKNPNTPQRKRK